MSYSPAQQEPQLPQKQRRKIQPLWRLLIGAAAIPGLFFLLAGHKAVQDINAYYFKTPSSSVSAVDVLVALAATYLLLVAILGHWRLLPWHRILGRGRSGGAA